MKREHASRATRSFGLASGIVLTTEMGLMHSAEHSYREPKARRIHNAQHGMSYLSRHAQCRRILVQTTTNPNYKRMFVSGHLTEGYRNLALVQCRQILTESHVMYGTICTNRNTARIDASGEQKHTARQMLLLPPQYEPIKSVPNARS